MKLQFWMVAGPNGSGKTTLVKRHIGKFKEQIPFINPDEIARRMNPADVSRVAIKAGMEAIKQQNAFLDSRASFAIETTFSGKRELKLLEKANSLGYKTNLVYIGLDSKDDNLIRVKNRVARGGHDVPVEDIERRYDRSMGNLEQGLLVADRSIVLDNSDRVHRILARFENGKITYLSKKIPQWFRRNVNLARFPKSAIDKGFITKKVEKPR